MTWVELITDLLGVAAVGCAIAFHREANVLRSAYRSACEMIDTLDADLAGLETERDALRAQLAAQTPRDAHGRFARRERVG